MQITIGAKCWDGERRTFFTHEDKGIRPKTEENTKLSDKLKQAGKIGGGLMIPFLLLPSRTFAAPEAVPVIANATKEKILHAFDPLIAMIQSLSYPIAGVMIAGGCLFIMVGNRERGMQMLQNAAIGYILVQLSPIILQLLVGVGQSV